MGKFRTHQAKSHRVREKKNRLRKKGGGAGEAGGARPGDKVAGGEARKFKHVTYSKENSILICGDGDFSFTRGVIEHRGTGTGVVSTSLDSRKAVVKKYPRAQGWLKKLEADGAQVAHSVDATRLEQTLFGGLSPKEVPESDGGRNASGGDVGNGRKVLFDRVVFNFPHTGKQRTHLNRNLISGFFASTKGLVKCADAGGEIHVTLKDKPPYSNWNIKAMAAENELVMLRTLVFDAAVFPGYRHSTTDPQAKEFKPAGAKTFVFCRARSPMDDEVDDTGAFPEISKPTDGSIPEDGEKQKDEGHEVDGRDGEDDGHDDEGVDEDSRERKAQRWIINADDSPLEEDALVSEDEGLTDGDERLGNTGTSRSRVGRDGKPSRFQTMQRSVDDKGDEDADRDAAGEGQKKRKRARRDNASAGDMDKRKKGKGEDIVSNASGRKKEQQKLPSGIDEGPRETTGERQGEDNGQSPLTKKKAWKRREQRRRAKDAARALAAAEAGEGEVGGDATGTLNSAPRGVAKVVEGGDPPARSAKRKRGKYVRRKPEAEGRRRGSMAHGFAKKGKKTRSK